MNKVVYPIEVPVPLTHPRLQEFCMRLRCEGDPIHVPIAAKLRPAENCYWNVLAEIENHGGEILFGWMLKHWPGLYLTAEHHAVWRGREGVLLDVTQRRPEIEGPTTFAIDSIQDYDLASAPNIHREFLPLTGDHRVIDLIDVSARFNSAAASVNRFVAYELGQSSNRQIDIANGEAPERVHFTAEQCQRYKLLVQRTTELRFEIGDMVSSLVKRPPNRTARAAARQFS